jgi:hypothetical protein
VVQPRVPHLFEQSVAAAPVDVAPAPVGYAAETMIEVPQDTYPPAPVSPATPEVATPFLDQFRPSPVAQAITPTPVFPEPPTPAPEMSKRDMEPPAPNDSAIQVRSVSRRVPSTPQRRPVTNNGRVPDAAVPSNVGPSQKEPSVSVRRSEPITPNHKPISHAPAAATPQLHSAEQQLPPIRINIGRVDVRAIMPAAPPVVPSSPRPKPALSLESYLKQREEGKR